MKYYQTGSILFIIKISTITIKNYCMWLLNGIV